MNLFNLKVLSLTQKNQSKLFNIIVLNFQFIHLNLKFNYFAHFNVVMHFLLFLFNFWKFILNFYFNLPITLLLSNFLILMILLFILVQVLLF